MKTKFAIGCLIQWYECDMVSEYIESLQTAIDSYGGDVVVDFTICLNQDLEKCISNEQLKTCEAKIGDYLLGTDFNYRSTRKLVTIADYRREFNSTYCNQADVLMWGESDALIPKQTFTILNSLHQQSLNNNYPKYLAFFGTCKMWDNSWEPIEHNELSKKPVNATAWWGTRYTMTTEEMNNINDPVENLDVRVVSPHKFNGCGLVISSEVVKSGVNIPESVFFVHEDTAFMHMTNKVLGNIPQYIIKNILLVHNRNHPNKRKYIQGEIGEGMKEKRFSNQWYSNANKMCEQNCYNLFNPQYKSFNWNDVWNTK